MTDDLIKRLREADSYNKKYYALDPLHNEAANYIEQLVKERDSIREAALREAAAKIQEQVVYLKDQHKELALNLAFYGRDEILKLIGEKK